MGGDIVAGKKKNWNRGTVPRYHGKALRVQMGIIPDPDVAREIAQAQTESWMSGSELYHKIRSIAGSVMDSRDNFVPAPFRAPYYAFVEEYYKEVVQRRIDADTVFNYLLAKYRGVNEGVVRAILEALASELPEFGPLPSKRA